MKKVTKTMMMIAAVFTVIFMTSCKKETLTQNHNPDVPTIQYGDALADGFNINWNAASDPDGDAVTYDVYLMDNVYVSKFKVAENLSSTTYHYVTSNEPTTVIIVAKDGKGGERTGVRKFEYTL
ncbi:MAG: Neutral metalloprotease [Bacteroidota bacterium]|nr:Neutral metalloprotease [Bacteroidota bacterium]